MCERKRVQRERERVREKKEESEKERTKRFENGKINQSKFSFHPLVKV